MTDITTNLKLTLAAFVLTASLSLSGCGTGEASATAEDADAAATPVPVVVAQPRRADIYATYETTTTIASDADAPVVARVGGEVVELLVEEGEHVSRGQILARLDGERLRLEMLKAKANVDQLRGEYERYVDLHSRGLVSAAMFEDMKYDLDSLQANYELKALNYDYANIRAPIAGVVSMRDIKIGQNVSVNDVVYRVTDTTELLASLHIPQTNLAKFAAGHTANLSVDAMPNTLFTATVVRISPTIDTLNGTFRATVSIDNRSGDLAPGMFAHFTIAYEKHPDALVIPTEALVVEDERTTVYVVVDGAVARRSIVVGIKSDDYIEVLGGLDDLEQIVVVGHAALRDGSKVLASEKGPDNLSG